MCTAGLRRGLQQADVNASGQPYVDTTVQLQLSGQAVYNLANSKGGQSATASNSFDAVMAQQGVHIQSQLLGARVMPYMLALSAKLSTQAMENECAWQHPQCPLTDSWRGGFDCRKRL